MRRSDMEKGDTFEAVKQGPQIKTGRPCSRDTGGHPHLHQEDGVCPPQSSTPHTHISWIIFHHLFFFSSLLYFYPSWKGKDDGTEYWWENSCFKAAHFFEHSKPNLHFYRCSLGLTSALQGLWVVSEQKKENKNCEL